jgi:hypothetical protein
MLALLLATAAAASSPPIQTRAELQPWAMFVGHCWSGAAPVPNGVDTHCFETVYGGQHVRDRHVVKINGKAVYFGEAVYSADGKQISFTYWNSFGGVGRGTATANDAELHFTGDMRASPNSVPEPMEATWRKIDGGYEVTDAGRTKRLFRRID